MARAAVSDARRPEERSVSRRPFPDGPGIPLLERLEGSGFGGAAEPGQFIAGEVADFRLCGHARISSSRCIEGQRPRSLLDQVPERNPKSLGQLLQGGKPGCHLAQFDPVDFGIVHSSPGRKFPEAQALGFSYSSEAKSHASSVGTYADTVKRDSEGFASLNAATESCPCNNFGQCGQLGGSLHLPAFTPFSPRSRVWPVSADVPVSVSCRRIAREPVP